MIGRDAGPFAVDLLPVPQSNPWLCQLRLSGFDFLADGRRAAVCTWDGDVWLVDGVDRPEKGLAWRRIASGLFQPLGLKTVADAIYVCCRDQIVRLRDLNGDGETDFYENFNNDHQVTEHFHEFAMDLQTDAEGNFYYAKAARHGLPALVPHHGTLLKVSRDGSRTEILATGFRAPNGVCLNPDGTFFLSDQEGFWTPKNRINWVKRNGFYGNMWGYTDVTDPSDSAMEQPVCWLTNAFDRSPAQLLWVDTENPAWKPLAGSLLCLSYGYGKIFVVPHEIVWRPDARGRVRLADPSVSNGRDAGPVPSRQRTALHLRPLWLGRRPDRARRLLSGSRHGEANVPADRPERSQGRHAAALHQSHSIPQPPARSPATVPGSGRSSGPSTTARTTTTNDLSRSRPPVSRPTGTASFSGSPASGRLGAWKSPTASGAGEARRWTESFTTRSTSWAMPRDNADGKTACRNRAPADPAKPGFDDMMSFAICHLAIRHPYPQQKGPRSCDLT